MKTNATSRRKFIGSSILGLSAYSLAWSNQAPQNLPHYRSALARSDTTYYICESGNLGKDSTFTLGLLSVPASGEFEDRIWQLRRQSNYFPRLTFGSNDRFQVPLAQQVISWLLEESNARFQVMAFSEPITSNNSHFPDAPSRWQLLQQKQVYYDHLLAKAKVQDSMVHVKYQSPLGPSPAYAQYFFSSHNVYYQATDTRTSNALQICGLLTSCVAAAHTGRPLSPIKATLVEHLQQVLDNQQVRPAMYWKDRFVFYA